MSLQRIANLSSIAASVEGSMPTAQRDQACSGQSPKCPGRQGPGPGRSADVSKITLSIDVTPTHGRTAVFPQTQLES